MASRMKTRRPVRPIQTASERRELRAWESFQAAGGVVDPCYSWLPPQPLPTPDLRPRSIGGWLSLFATDVVNVVFSDEPLTPRKAALLVVYCSSLLFIAWAFVTVLATISHSSPH